MDAPHYFTPEDERCLIRAAQNGDLQARDKLILGALPFVEKAIWRRYPSINQQDIEDLVQETVPALISCLDRYDLNHPARARLYVFASADVHRVVCKFFKHSKLLSYREEVPDISSKEDPEACLQHEQTVDMALTALATLSPQDRDVLISRLAGEKPVSRRVLAERYRCPPHVIQYAEQRAVDQFLAALPFGNAPCRLASVN